MSHATTEITPLELQALTMCVGGCFCESYYSYQCCLCEMIADGKHTEAFGSLIERGLLERGGYSPYKLTKAGEYTLKQLGD